MEQQLPLGQVPHIVPLFEEPHVPSVVALAVEADPGPAVDETGSILGSPRVVVVAPDVPSVQPSWQPLAARQ
jgi:hypothetical protein